MKLFEFDNQMPLGMYDATSDEVTKAEITDTRKGKLTLRDVNRLKKLKAFRKLQNLKRQDELAVIYGQGDGEDDGGEF
jgi:hypothetical protein